MPDELQVAIESCCARLEPHGYFVMSPHALEALHRQADDAAKKHLDFARHVMAVLNAACSCGLAGLCEACESVDTLDRTSPVFHAVDRL
jgi:hypothetical protein